MDIVEENPSNWPTENMYEIESKIGMDINFIRMVYDPIKKDDVNDRTYKYILNLASGKKLFFIISNTNYPKMVENAIVKLKSARCQIDSQNNYVIEKPLLEGSLEKNSYAIWKLRHPISKNRAVRYFQQRIILWKVFDWLSEVASQTLKSDIGIDLLQLKFFNPLNAIADNICFKSQIRKVCSYSIRKLEEGLFAPKLTLQHSDFWIGNVLITSNMDLINPNKFGFIIIDWGGYENNGYPFFDLFRFLISCKVNVKVAEILAKKMAKIIGCKVVDIPFYLLCSIGNIYQNLDHFPEERLFSLCNMIWDYTNRIKIFRNYYNSII